MAVKLPLALVCRSVQALDTIADHTRPTQPATARVGYQRRLLNTFRLPGTHLPILDMSLPFNMIQDLFIDLELESGIAAGDSEEMNNIIGEALTAKE